MTDLEKILSRTAVLESEIAVRQRELEELATAARVIRRLSDDADNPATETPGSIGDTTESPKRTIMSMAKEILAEGGEMYYSDVANLAIANGYHGKAGSSNDRVRQSFWAIMKRNPEVFVATGGGNFRLKSKTAQ